MSKRPINSKGSQDNNLGKLNKLLSKKEVIYALTEIGKMDASTWNQVGDTIKDLKDVASMGGINTIVSNIKETIELQFDQALAPITNQLNAISSEMLSPILVKLNDLSMKIAGFITGNETGAFFGAMIGSIGGPIGTIVGAVIGAGIEKDIETLIREIEEVNSWMEGFLLTLKVIAGVLGLPSPDGSEGGPFTLPIIWPGDDEEYSFDF